jgi:hypothetical protein
MEFGAMGDGGHSGNNGGKTESGVVLIVLQM